MFKTELGYNDSSNPFGDDKLTDKFVWKKRTEYLQAAGLYRESGKEMQVNRMEGKIKEIHQVKQRRDEREVERQLLEKQRQEQERERHAELFDEWVDSENRFHLDNAKSRSLLRIEQGRERPIDLCVKALDIIKGVKFEDMTILDKPPQVLFAEMGLTEVEDMMTDIETNQKADAEHKSFWKAMLFACSEAIEAKHREKAGGKGFGEGVAEGVASEIHELLGSKTQAELDDMQDEIKVSLRQGGEGLDTQFFESIAAKIPLYMSHAEINLWHNQARRKVDAFMEAMDEPEPEYGSGGKKAAAKSSSVPAEASPEAPAASEDAGGDWAEIPSGPAAALAAGADGGLSPELEPLSALEEAGGAGNVSPVLEPLRGYVDEDLLDPDEDERLMLQVRQTLVDAFCGPGGASSSADAGVDRSADDDMVAAEKAKGMGEHEVAFNAAGKGNADEFHGEVSLPRKHYEWEDKYRPRKPRFFNRVKTGFEWNKYNQTHYDSDNPPPKRVQGYKFNIFYPDLIDKTKAPTYYVEKDPDSEETVLLRFHAGPPYEDVAFKIVNCEWNLSHRFGFRVVFDRGVLQLYFNFKRWRYRR